MGKWDKLTKKILTGTSDANIAFDDVCRFLLHLGFEMRTRGSHHVFRKQGVMEMPNLQRSGKNAKPYQVRQIRSILLKYKMGDVD